jgi:large subunit ribosomal protein L21
LKQPENNTKSPAATASLSTAHPEADAKTMTFDRVLLVAGGGSPKLGSPLVSGASVTAEVVGAAKADKITTQKYKRRKGYHKKIGHRQPKIEVRITDIKA